jgi:hypothetical protein
MYGVSFVLEFIVWHSFMRSTTTIPWLKDLQLYAFSNLSRRLPSGLGYLFVRAVQYREEGINSALVLYFSAQEFVLLVTIGATVALASFSTVIDLGTGILAILILILIMFATRPLILADLLQRVTRGKIELAVPRHASERLVMSWIGIYLVAWINGGVMLHLLLSSLTGVSDLGLRRTIGYWAFSATLGLVGGMLPAGQLARDASLSVILENHLSLPVSILVALAFRFIITIGDVVWSLLLFGFSSFTRKRYCQ